MSMMAENRTDRTSFIGRIESQLGAFFREDVGYVVLGSSERTTTTSEESFGRTVLIVAFSAVLREVPRLVGISGAGGGLAATVGRIGSVVFGEKRHISDAKTWTMYAKIN
jgi:hypothetical protein